jgi:hypothetical protein
VPGALPPIGSAVPERVMDVSSAVDMGAQLAGGPRLPAFTRLSSVEGAIMGRS